ncbi:ribonuclease P protein subunit [Candidatus Woesearchaeota archaeon]|nr:ribonuclease P protein subunit [Candidatus Woesearchaeota archaeon]
MPKQRKPARIALIGTTLEVVSARNATLTGLRGRVTDETKSTIKIQTQNGTKTIVKEQVTVKVGDKTIDGKDLQGRIEARIKQ